MSSDACEPRPLALRNLFIISPSLCSIIGGVLLGMGETIETGSA